MTILKNDLIIESFQKMDLSMLEVLSDENGIFNGMTKNVFIEKISNVFESFKKYNNTTM